MVTAPEQKTQIVQKPPVEMTAEEASKIGAKPGQSQFGPVVEQQTVVIKPDQATVVEPEKKVLAKEPTPPNFDQIKELVMKSLEEAKQESSIDEEKIKSLITEALKNSQSNSAKVALIDEKIPQAREKTLEVSLNSPVVAASERDVERLILEKAEAEEKAREEAQEKARLEKEKLQVQRKLEEKIPSPVGIEQEVSEQSLKSEFEKLKATLTNLDKTGKIAEETKKQIFNEMQKLEQESVVAKQMDELKAKTERRKINEQLQALLQRAGQSPSPVEKEANIEVLKQEEKTKITPEEKARIIAQIKDLEREAAARKAALASRPVVKAQPAFGKMLPNTPTIPNVINGIVKDQRGLLLSTVVIIVKDKNGNPVRAFKTNKIGQFALSTPLPNGTYTLELEKEGYNFDIIEVEVNGEIMRPIEIKAK
jgi:hypothetical protein